MTQNARNGAGVYQQWAWKLPVASEWMCISFPKQLSARSWCKSHYPVWHSFVNSVLKLTVLLKAGSRQIRNPLVQGLFQAPGTPHETNVVIPSWKFLIGWKNRRLLLNQRSQNLFTPREQRQPRKPVNRGESLMCMREHRREHSRMKGTWPGKAQLGVFHTERTPNMGWEYSEQSFHRTGRSKS